MGRCYIAGELSAGEQLILWAQAGPEQEGNLVRVSKNSSLLISRWATWGRPFSAILPLPVPAMGHDRTGSKRLCSEHESVETWEDVLPLLMRTSH